MKHTVVKGDSLYSISKTYYGKGFLWRFIALVNLKVRPNKLKVGESIWIPMM